MKHMLILALIAPIFNVRSLYNVKKTFSEVAYGTWKESTRSKLLGLFWISLRKIPFASPLLKQSIISYFRYFLKINFRFQQKVCNGYHDMTKILWTCITLQMLLLEKFITELTFGSKPKARQWIESNTLI